MEEKDKEGVALTTPSTKSHLQNQLYEKKDQKSNSDEINLSNWIDFDLMKVKLTQRATFDNSEAGDHLIMLNWSDSTVRGLTIIEKKFEHVIFVRDAISLQGFSESDFFDQNYYHFDNSTLERRGDK